jgi:hypothetical protein
MAPIERPNHRTPSRKSLEGNDKRSKRHLGKRIAGRAPKCSICGTRMVFEGTWICPKRH